MDISKITTQEVVIYLRENIKIKESLINTKEFTDSCEELESFARENYIPIIQKESLDVVNFFIRDLKPKRILELGTAMAYSSIQFKKSSPKETIIDTLERNDKMIELAKKNIKDFEYTNFINVIEGEILDSFKYLKDKGFRYDLVFIDAGKSHYDLYLENSLSMLNENGMIICDNVLFDGNVALSGFIPKKNRTIINNMKNFLKSTYQNMELNITLIPVGDGLLLIKRMKKDE